ncbi:MAG: S26 family signal peptidase [Micrococcales bacterium]|nr:S26 family signal peptidase [Micrococcales bacterium]
MIKLGLVKVRGRSMEPGLHAGDRLLVVRGIPPLLGRPHVVRLPPDDDGARRPLAIKRVTGRDPADPTRYWVERDNPRTGVDSWQVGSLAKEDIRAAMLFRLPGIPRVAPYVSKGIANGLQQASRLTRRG